MIVVFDVEGVLVDGEFLPEVARLLGREREVSEITRKGISGELDWECGLAQRIELIKGLSYDSCISVANKLRLMKGAKEATDRLRRRGTILIGVSGGFTILADRVKKELNLDHIFSNELVFHDGKLIGYGVLVNSNKTIILDTAFGELLGREKIVAVVDGANDLDLFNIADLRIAFNAQDVVKKRADVVVEGKDLTKVIEAIESNPRHSYSLSNGRDQAQGS